MCYLISPKVRIFWPTLIPFSTISSDLLTNQWSHSKHTIKPKATEHFRQIFGRFHVSLFHRVIAHVHTPTNQQGNNGMRPFIYIERVSKFVQEENLQECAFSSHVFSTASASGCRKLNDLLANMAFSTNRTSNLNDSPGRL